MTERLWHRRRCCGICWKKRRSRSSVLAPSTLPCPKKKASFPPAATSYQRSVRSYPLAGHSYDYVYRCIKPDVHLASISGGTDIVSCFALGNPIAPVWRGELQTRGLGMAVEVFDEKGTPIREDEGELVCTRPFPSMPVSFWNDPDGAKYRAA